MALFSSSDPSPLSRAEIPSLHMENSILKRKVETLSRLCENHKSRYEQLSAKYKYEMEDQQNKSQQEIDGLKSQLITQSQQLLANEQEIANLKQESVERDKSYQQKIKHMQQKLHQRLSTIEQLENQVKERDLEITVLKFDVADHECNISTPCFEPQAISNFDLTDLNGPYPLPIYKRYRSPSTINITNAPESFTMSQNQPGSLSSWQKQYIMQTVDPDTTPTMKTNVTESETATISVKNMTMDRPKINLRNRVSNSRPKAYKLRPETSTPNSSYDDILEEIDFENIDSLSDSESPEINNHLHDLPSLNNMGSDPYDTTPEPMLVKRSRNSFLMTMLERSETEISFDVIVDEELEYRE